jgi:hypothetical protein
MQLHNRIDADILSKNESVISKPYFSSAQNLMNWLIGKNLKQCKITIHDASFTKTKEQIFPTTIIFSIQLERGANLKNIYEGGSS